MLAAKEQGAKRAVMLPVSAPFHSSLLKPAAERLAQRLAQVPIAAPSIPVVHNVDVAMHPRAGRDPRRAGAAGGEPGALDADRSRPSRPPGVTHVVECGPGKVLADLVKRIDDRLEALALTSGSMLDDALAQLR